MDIKTAKRLEHFQTGIFAALNEKKEELIASGRTVYNLFVGTPDFPVGKHIQEALIEAAKDPDNFHYSLRDIPELLDAVKNYYQKRFGVEIATDEIASVNGSQEGIGHVGMALCNPGDVVRHFEKSSKRYLEYFKNLALISFCFVIRFQVVKLSDFKRHTASIPFKFIVEEINF